MGIDNEVPPRIEAERGGTRLNEGGEVLDIANRAMIGDPYAVLPRMLHPLCFNSQPY